MRTFNEYVLNLEWHDQVTAILEAMEAAEIENPIRFLIDCAKDYPEIEVCLLDWHNTLLQEAPWVDGSTPAISPTAAPAAPKAAAPAAGAQVGGKPVYGQQTGFFKQVGQAFKNLMGPSQRFGMAQKALAWLKDSIDNIQKMNPNQPLEAPQGSNAKSLSDYLNTVMQQLQNSQAKLPQMVTGYTQGQMGPNAVDPNKKDVDQAAVNAPSGVPGTVAPASA